MIHVVKVETPDEYEEVLAIRRAVFVEEQGVPAELEVDEHESEATYFLALDEEGQAVGTGRLRLKDDVLKFERIATLKSVRGQGVGQALMTFMQGYAEEVHPHHRPYMHAQASAISFYEKIGWVTQGPRFFEAGIEHAVMVRAPS
jgi:predicted GNAT family N-acyltransferase